jgi:hypothetical protein
MDNWYHSLEYEEMMKKLVSEAGQMMNFFGKSTCIVSTGYHEYKVSLLTPDIQEEKIAFYFIWEDEHYLMGNNGIRLEGE